MIRLVCTLCLAVILPISANATSTASIINTNCSGSLTSSLIDGASFACAGNLTLDGGFISSDSVINISADGDLSIDNLILTAPNITFSVMSGILTMGKSVQLKSSSITALVQTYSNPLNIVQSSPKEIISWPKFNNSQVSSGAVLTIGNGRDLKDDAGIGYVLNSGRNIPAVGGTLIIVGSGDIITAGSRDNGSLINVMAAPEPSTYLMVLLGLGFIAYRRHSSTKIHAL